LFFFSPLDCNENGRKKKKKEKKNEGKTSEGRGKGIRKDKTDQREMINE
jgi:hypothetical protein